MPLAPEVLAGPRDRDGPAVRRRSALLSQVGRAGWWVAGGVVVALALSSVGPPSWGGPDTGVRLVAAAEGQLTIVDVDTGDTDPLASGAAVEDQTGPVQWLYGDALQATTPAGATPPWTGGRQVVGSVDQGVLTLVGNTRLRRLQLWDLGYTEVSVDLGTAQGVSGVNEREVLVTRGCLILGCPTELVALADGSRRELLPPPGFTLSHSALAADGTVALGVTEETGKYGADGRFGILVGRPGSWRVVPDLAGLVWDGLDWGPDGWLVLHLVTGDVVLWREGESPVTVDLPDGSRVIGVSASR